MENNTFTTVLPLLAYMRPGINSVEKAYLNSTLIFFLLHRLNGFLHMDGTFDKSIEPFPLNLFLNPTIYRKPNMKRRKIKTKIF